MDFFCLLLYLRGAKGEAHSWEAGRKGEGELEFGLKAEFSDHLLELAHLPFAFTKQSQ